MKDFSKQITPEHLKHLRSILNSTLDFDGLLALFKAANLPIEWPYPFEQTVESWEKLFRTLFEMKGDQFKAPQNEMLKIIESI